MLDRPDARLDAGADGAVGVGVGGDIGPLPAAVSTASRSSSGAIIGSFGTPCGWKAAPEAISLIKSACSASSRLAAARKA